MREEKTVTALVSQQTEELDNKVKCKKCKMILEG